VHVAVRTDDGELTRSLQSDLGDLVSRLQTKGYKTTAWTTEPHIDVDRGLERGGNAGAEHRFSDGRQGHHPDGGRDQHRRQRAPWESGADQNFHIEQQETEADDNGSD